MYRLMIEKEKLKENSNGNLISSFEKSFSGEAHPEMMFFANVTSVKERNGICDSSQNDHKNELAQSVTSGSFNLSRWHTFMAQLWIDFLRISSKPT